MMVRHTESWCRAFATIVAWLALSSASNADGVAPLAHIIASEVTQGIQDDKQSVTLLSGKPAIVRVYFSYSGSQPLSNWHGEVTLSDPATGDTIDLNSIRPVAVSLRPSTPADIEEQRLSLSSGLTFKIPSDWTTRTQIVIGGLKSFAGRNAAPVSCDNCNAWTQTIAFAPAPKLSVVLVGLRYSFNGTPFFPRDIDYKYAASYMARLYPAGAVDVETRTVDWNPAPVIGGANSTFNCDHANVAVSQVRTLDLSAGGNPLAHYYGMVFDGGDNVSDHSLWMGGCAAVIPTAPNTSAVASGPTGTHMPPGTDWSRLPTYGDWYAAHELGHTFGRVHVGTTCSDIPVDPTYPYTVPKRGEISDSQHTFVGFDIGDQDLDILPTILAGSSTFDAMTYCNNEWISDYNYLGILDRIRAESTAAPAAMIAQTRGAGTAAEAGPGAIPAPPSIGEPQAPLISITGVVNFTRNTASIDAIDPVRAPASASPSQSNEDYVVKTLDKNGNVLSRQQAVISHSTDIPSGQDQTGLLNAIVPYDQAIAQIVVEHQGQVVAAATAGVSGFAISKPSATVPDFGLVAKDKLLVGQTAFAAQNGAGHFSREDGSIVYSWSAVSVPAGQTVLYGVQLATDDGPWRTVAINLKQPKLLIDQTWIKNARVMKLRVIAVSGVHSFIVTSDDLAIYANTTAQ
jgi:hypothetical protein